MPTCRTERIFFSNLRVTFFAKHHFTVTKSRHAIRLICKNVVKRFSSKYFFSILVTKHFSILKQFSEIFLSILNFLSQSRNIFIGFNFFFDSVLFFSNSFFFFFFFTLKYFYELQICFIDYESLSASYVQLSY